MVNELCLKYKCKECPEQLRCVGCEHNYILIKQETTSNLYKCSKCGNKIRLNKDDACCDCVNTCKGKVQAIIDKSKGIYQKCSRFNKGEKYEV